MLGSASVPPVILSWEKGSCVKCAHYCALGFGSRDVGCSSGGNHVTSEDQR